MELLSTTGPPKKLRQYFSVGQPGCYFSFGSYDRQIVFDSPQSLASPTGVATT